MALTILQFGPTVGYGFDYDDYHFVRPYPRSEVLHAFHGTWDSSSIEVPFYRPLTICLYAARFLLFGVNANACHVFSLVLFAVAAALLATFVTQALGRLSAGLFGGAIFVFHPSLPYSAAVWITNQMHLAELIVVLCGLCWWFFVRHRSAVWWLPLLGFQLAAVLVKEDGVMLLPAIVTLHALRRALVERDLPRAPRGFLVASVTMLTAVLAWRQSALTGIGGYHLPTLDRAWSNLTSGISGVYRLLPAKRPYQLVTSVFVVVLPAAALLLWRRMSPGARFGLAAGFLVSVIFDLPFVFVVKGEQLHLVATGAALFLTAAATGVMEAIPFAFGRAVVGCALAAGIAAMAAVSRNISRDFEPFGPIVLGHDAIVREWAAVPAEIRDYLAEKRLPGANQRLSANPADAVDSVWFGLHGWETSPDGVRLRWMSGTTADLYVRATARSVTIPLRHEFGAFQEPAHATISADGRILDEIPFTDGAWRHAITSLQPVSGRNLTRMHHVRIRIARSWVPAEVIPQSKDRRTLGLQIGVTEVR